MALKRTVAFPAYVHDRCTVNVRSEDTKLEKLADACIEYQVPSL